MDGPAALEILREKLKATSQADLALQLDVSEATVSRWLNGEAEPRGQRLRKLVAWAAGRSEGVFPYRPIGSSSGVSEPAPEERIGPRELRGYALAVRDMLASAQAAQERLIEGLASLPERVEGPSRVGLRAIVGELTLREMMADEDALDDLEAKVAEAKAAAADEKRRKRA